MHKSKTPRAYKKLIGRIFTIFTISIFFVLYDFTAIHWQIKDHKVTINRSADGNAVIVIKIPL